ncbi:MAG: integration host factor subunit alpha [Rhodobiaceae bacterium]|jgi:integration host factor subunit alpha|nr:integration host factor subunit alpha [Rhodobiaceae bacterium]MDB4832080.1 integration host factor subunit alpha [Hyphomicrobiales bacterium]MDC3271975.1 integration host factor subunit alpha [Hyphomicrobiales bacterium]|tara:strand:- start:318 stop:617 length:300 start_codon:yes stop_codon:yes gene_type:complete
MAIKTITRNDIGNAVYREMGLSRKESLEIVENIIQKNIASLENGQNIKISAFGSFLLRIKKQRIGRNPKTGVEAIISPRKVVVFRPSTILRKKINKSIF